MFEHASALDAAGKEQDAIPLYRESLALEMRTLGESHATTAMTEQNLAQVQQLRGRLDEAELLYRDMQADIAQQMLRRLAAVKEL